LIIGEREALIGVKKNNFIGMVFSYFENTDVVFAPGDYRFIPFIETSAQAP
jgi:hypothetical protein